jgi:uncharacterized protein YggT (Ycf19 family)
MTVGLLIANVLSYGLKIVTILITVRIIVSFLPQFERGHPLVDVLEMVTAPFLMPFRRLSMGRGASGGTIDFSPLYAIITLQFVVGLLVPYALMLPF